MGAPRAGTRRRLGPTLAGKTDGPTGRPWWAAPIGHDPAEVDLQPSGLVAEARSAAQTFHIGCSYWIPSDNPFRFGKPAAWAAPKLMVSWGLLAPWPAHDRPSGSPHYFVSLTDLGTT
ncbi:MAG TPA: hypothetical protein VEJ84_04780 [Acidimicrobiales bacterium]|nr:hypothetical protein [Acidimicrobiales bacterium]